MSKHVELLSTEKTAAEAVSRLAKLVLDKSQKNYQSGKYVITSNGVVLKVVTLTSGQSKTEQAYKDDTDINTLLQPAIKRGLLRHGIQFEGEYDDIPAADFQEAQFIVSKGKSMFEALPSAIRNKFENSPSKFMAFVQDPANKEWLVRNKIVKGLDGRDRDGQFTGYTPAEKEPEASTTEPEVTTPST